MRTILKYQPTNGIISQFDDFFNDCFCNDSFCNVKSPENVLTPDYDVIEKDDSFLVEFSLAGFSKEDVSINVDKDILTIEGERKNKEEKYNRKGSFFGKFNKSFTLPDNVVADEIDASFTDGILMLDIPKDEKSKLRKTIEIQ